MTCAVSIKEELESLRVALPVTVARSAICTGDAVKLAFIERYLRPLTSTTARVCTGSGRITYPLSYLRPVRFQQKVIIIVK
jgi:hypothetical protein